MAKYIEQRLDISDNQKEKIKTAMNNNTIVSIRINNIGDDKIALTEGQINKINKAFQQNKAVTIKLSKAQLQYNKNHVEGGFIGALLAGLAPLAMKVLPQVAKHLGIGALTGLASSAIGKLLGNGIYLKKNGHIVKIKDGYSGSGLVLKPQPTQELETFADGLYVKKDGQIYEGSGILSNLLHSIPLLNLIV